MSAPTNGPVAEPPQPGPPQPGPPQPGPPRGATPGPPGPGAYGFMRPGPPPAPADHAATERDAEVGEEVGAAGHPAVDNMVRALDNAAQLEPGEQVAEYEAAHRVLQETLASIDRS